MNNANSTKNALKVLSSIYILSNKLNLRIISYIESNNGVFLKMEFQLRIQKVWKRKQARLVWIPLQE